MFRIGFGYDVHPLVEGRPLVLGGVNIPYGRGLLGHSDADVLTHALIDAILGALGSGDIGQLFPDSDPAYKGVVSISLLEVVRGLLNTEHYIVQNVDATIVAQEPKLAPYFDSMKQKLAEALGIESRAVNLKATTTEGLGFCGKKEGFAAYAVVSIRKTTVS